MGAQQSAEGKRRNPHTAYAIEDSGYGFADAKSRGIHGRGRVFLSSRFFALDIGRNSGPSCSSSATLGPAWTIVRPCSGILGSAYAGSQRTAAAKTHRP